MDKDDLLLADADAALELYRGLLREMVGELAEATAALPAGYERLCAGLETFWEAAFARRRQLREARALATEPELGRIRRPFNHLLYSELLRSGCADPATQVAPLIEDVGSIARAELLSGRRSRQRRSRLLQQVGASCRA